MKSCPFIKNSNGYSLLEVLLAVTILGIMFFTIMGFFSQSFTYVKENESKTVGVNVGRNVLHYFEKQNFDKMNTALISLGEESRDLNGMVIPEKKELVVNEDTCNLINIENCDNILQLLVNNVNYKANVKLLTHDDVKLRSFLIPIEIKITWNEKETTIKGVIKRE